ncbi:MAG TPA: PhzF family phenazine biosynthesis protein [Polyangiaceae bacterium]|nr:PhzF family phenazine biosynthesis protein [Polyangiaceae bacterium]
MRTFRYQLCDVFTERPLCGNALAVFTDAVGLDDTSLQALARELNLSECAFVLPPSTPAADARLRIFTPSMELPFAGHPTLGTAFVLTAEKRGLSIRLETARGISVVTFSRPALGPAFGWMTQPVPEISAYARDTELLGALGVEAGAVRAPIELYDNGPHYVLVELASAAAVARLAPDMRRLQALGSIAAVVFAPHDTRWKARVFAPGEGISEDPATGAAAGPIALYLGRHGRVPFATEVSIDQGVEVGRPSTLFARARGGAEPFAVEVGGNAVVIGRGEVDLP